MKIGIVGGGGIVGSSCAFTLARELPDAETVLVDINEETAHGHAIDIEHAMAMDSNTVIAVGGYADIADANVVVVTAGASTSSDSTDRNTLLEDNIKVLRSVFNELTRHHVNCPIVITTNPVDVLVTILNDEYDFSQQHILGYNLNDTLRFQWAIADFTGTDPLSVSGFVLGEHGDTQVPVFSSVRINGDPPEFTQQEQKRIFRRGRDSAWEMSQKKNETARWATGFGLTKIVTAICQNSSNVFPCSIPAPGYVNDNDVSYGVPVFLGQDGAEGVMHINLTATEQEQLTESVATIRTQYQQWNQ